MAEVFGTATSYIDLADQLAEILQADSCQEVTSISGGGTGYTVGDILTVGGGTPLTGLPTTLEVTSVSSGVIDGVKVHNAGAYTSAPSNPVSVTGGTGGDDATFNLDFQSNGWTEDRNQVWSGSDKEYILHGSGGGTDEIYVAFRTFNTGSAFNIQFNGLAGYSSGDTYENQPGRSPGLHTQVTGEVGGIYLLCAATAAQALTFWIQVDPYAFSVVCKNSSTYSSAYAGFGNPFGTATDFPYPLVLAGSCTDPTTVFSSSAVFNAGVSRAMAHSTLSTVHGPVLYRRQDGQWESFKNCGFSTGVTLSQFTDRILFPTGAGLSAVAGNPIPEEDLVFDDNITMDDVVTVVGNHATAGSFAVAPVPDSGGDLRFLIPLTLIDHSGLLGSRVELRNLYWFDAIGGVVAEDIIPVDGVNYRVFRCGTRTERWDFFCMRSN